MDWLGIDMKSKVEEALYGCVSGYCRIHFRERELKE